MRFYEFKSVSLYEGVGLSNRRPGEKFENDQGDVLYFQGLDFIPNVGKLGSIEELEKTKESLPMASSIEWTNQPNKNTLAIGIAKFKDAGGKEYFFGRYFKDIKANRKDNDFPHKSLPGGFKYSTKSGAKENAGYKPSQVLSEFIDLTPESIADQITTKFGNDSDEAKAVHLFLGASDFPVAIPKGNMNGDAFRIYFCEMLQPMALMKGMGITGNYQEAVTRFLGENASLSECTVTFNDSTGGQLSDSVLKHPNGSELRISTKAGSGAKASAQGLLKAIDELKNTDEGMALLEKHPTVMPILESFKGNLKKDGSGYDGKTHFTAPLDIAKLAKLITEDEANQVLALKDMNLGLGEEIVGKGLISPKLEKWYSDYLEKWKKPVVPIHTLMLIIAFKACKWVNEETDFNKAASKILNHSALIQVYNFVEEKDDHFVIVGMNARYPSKAVTGVTLTTEKAYWTTGAQGNMTFNIDYNGGDPITKVASPKSTSPQIGSYPSDTSKPVGAGSLEPAQKEKPQEPDNDEVTADTGKIVAQNEPIKPIPTRNMAQAPVPNEPAIVDPEEHPEEENPEEIKRLKKNAGIRV